MPEIQPCMPLNDSFIVQFGPEAQRPSRDQHINHQEWGEMRPRYMDMASRLRAGRCNFLYGHEPLLALRGLAHALAPRRPALGMMLLREPLDRTLSLWHYGTKHGVVQPWVPDELRERGLVAALYDRPRGPDGYSDPRRSFDQSPVCHLSPRVYKPKGAGPVFCNLQTWYLAGRTAAAAGSAAATAAAAIAALRRLDVVGLQEHFGASLCLLYHRLGLSAFAAECPGAFARRVNPSPNRGLVELSHAQDYALREVLSWDVQLYAAARTLFFERIAEVEHATGVTLVIEK